MSLTSESTSLYGKLRLTAELLRQLHRGPRFVPRGEFGHGPLGQDGEQIEDALDGVLGFAEDALSVGLRAPHAGSHDATSLTSPRPLPERGEGPGGGRMYCATRARDCQTVESVASEGAVHVIGQGVNNIGEPQASDEKTEELGVNGKRPQRIEGGSPTR
jgi:hypothetical protein